jgi:hypothetical protein
MPILLGEISFLYCGDILLSGKGNWISYGGVQILGSVLGLLIALLFRARFCGYLVAAFLAAFSSELLIELYYVAPARFNSGNQIALHGAPTHFAILAAGFLGVAFGAILAIYAPKMKIRSSSAAAESH